MEGCICSKIFGDDEWTYTLLILKHNVIIYKYLKVSTLILYFMYNYSKRKEIRTDFLFLRVYYNQRLIIMMLTVYYRV